VELDSRFIAGVLYGGFVVAVLGFLLNHIRTAQTQAGLLNRPMSNFPASAQTELTSAGVVGTSQAAGCRQVGLMIALVVAVLLSFGGCLLISSQFSSPCF
jgi:hypothetical protein